MKSTSHRLAICSLIAFAASLQLHAQLVPDGGTLNFTGSTNLGGQLKVGDNTGGTTLNIISPGTVTNGAAFIGFGVSSDNNLVSVQNSGAAWDTGPIYVGYNGDNNTLIITNGGQMVSTDDSTLGWSVGAVGNTVLVTGAGSEWSIGDELNVGNGATGNQLVISNGGMVANSRSYIGRNSGFNEVTVTGTGSLWTNETFLITGNSSAMNRLKISDGGVVVSGNGTIGAGSGVQNVAEVTGPGSRWNNTGNLIIGVTGSGNDLIVSNGATVTSSLGYIDFVSSGFNDATVTGSGSVWDMSSDLRIGNNSAQNKLIISNGALVANTSGYIGDGTGSSETRVEVTGAGSIWTNRNAVYVGDAGYSSRLVISDGATVFSSSGHLGVAPSSSNNIVTVSGPGSLWTNTFSLRVGDAGDGNELIISNGATVAASAIAVIGSTGSEDNTALVADPDSLLLVPGSFVIGSGGGSTGNQLTLRNGATVVSSFAYLAGNNGVATVSGIGSLWTNSNTLDVGSGSSSGNELIVSDGATVHSHELSVGFDGADNVLRLDKGTVTTTSGLVVKANNTLAGDGTVNGPVTIASGGAISPGTSFGKLILNSSPSLQGNMVMEIEKSGGLPVTNDHLQVNAPLTYGGTLVVTNLGNGIGINTLAAGDTWQLFTATSYSGAFTGQDLPVLPVGLEWALPETNGILSISYVSQPIIAGLQRSGNLLFFDFKGFPGDIYQVVSSPDMTVPLASWQVLSSGGQFDANGDASDIFIYTSTEEKRFYAVKLL